MRGEQHNSQERSGEQQIDPKIYAASLSDYNNGHLHGAWIEAAQPPEAIKDEIDEMLIASPQPDAEEWAVHDYEDFGAFKLGEYEDLEIVSLVANGIARHGRAFSHWVNVVGTMDTERLVFFDEHYRGNWNSMTEYAQDYLDDMGVTVESFAPGWLRPYVSIDYAGLGRDLSADLETADDLDGTVHVFEAEL